ncbi:DUF6576 domain-containing protein [Halpernia frigidisoli]|uniref:DUF6576 domain-containing protein n=1 Tax=Halpernia frigidisoli TaxID=1125876 RepID=A0A1I3I675_9FLAO|nr:DUF6576 domain-containing protein [Halpernia frigidisoli]SFI43498.1 hypothetical protein SAMN05443292_2586 [Halpernia frigidisoli]
MSESIILFIIALVIFLYFFRNKLFKNYREKLQKSYTIDDQFNSDKREREKEIDKLLSKMGENGKNDLSEKDQKRLDELSKKIN